MPSGMGGEHGRERDVEGDEEERKKKILLRRLGRHQSSYNTTCASKTEEGGKKKKKNRYQERNMGGVVETVVGNVSRPSAASAEARIQSTHV